MFVLGLALIDLFAAVIIPISYFFPSLNYLVLMAAGLLLLKSLFFLDDFASWIDLVAVFFLVLESFGIDSIFAYVMVVWLIQKGLRSLF